ncbi:MAG: methyltransferase domain-containing protein [Anaerolineae bacterium]|nr:methyltransferase domain-containing protein [Anaerolineae bacterium]
MTSQLPPLADIPIPDSIPEDSHWWFASRTRALNAVIEPLLPKTPDFRLLDVGCGAGNMIHHLSKYGRVKGLEIDARPVKVARQERGYDVDLFDVTQPMPFDDNSFDAVTALDVIEHNEDDMAILADSYRILKPGGHMIITVPAFMFLWSHNDDINAHVRRYTSDELKQKLAQTGFEVSRVTYNNFFVFPLAAALILLRRSSKAEPELASHHLSEEEYQVEMEPASPPVNAVLTVVGQVEAGLIRYVNLPFGTSLIAVGQKPK